MSRTPLEGLSRSGSYNVARYWKNSKSIWLTDETKPSTANVIIVKGSDVYIAGSEGSSAKYWLNGNPVNLTDGRNEASASSIFVVE